jgi:hypothetical protein
MNCSVMKKLVDEHLRGRSPSYDCGRKLVIAEEIPFESKDFDVVVGYGKTQRFALKFLYIN